MLHHEKHLQVKAPAEGLINSGNMHQRSPPHHSKDMRAHQEPFASTMPPITRLS